MRVASNLLPLWPRTAYTRRGRRLSMVTSLNVLLVLLPLASLTHAEMVFEKASPGEGSDLRSSSKITFVLPEQHEGGLTVYILANRKIRGYRTFPLSSPPRLVIDLLGVQGSLIKEDMQVNSPFIKSVRIGTSYKDKVRMVFDLRSTTKHPYKIHSLYNQLRVTFGAACTSPTEGAPVENIAGMSPSIQEQSHFADSNYKDNSYAPGYGWAEPSSKAPSENAPPRPKNNAPKEEAIPSETLPRMDNNYERASMNTSKSLTEPSAIDSFKHQWPSTLASMLQFNKEDMGFSISLGPTLFLASKAGDFTIVQPGSSSSQTWRINGSMGTSISILPSFRFHKYFSAGASFEMSIANDISTTILTLGPRFLYPRWRLIVPYIDVGGVYGKLDWAESPGGFDDGLGWQAGLGASFLDGPFKLGLSLIYRNISFTYQPVSGLPVTSNADSMNFSGYNITALMTYCL